MRNSLNLSLSVVMAIAIGILTAPITAAADQGHATLLKDIAAGETSSNPDDLTTVGAVFYFTAEGPGGRELYASDGVPEGTFRLNVRPGGKSSTPDFLTALGTRVYFSANGGDGHGRELWVSDGSALGTHIVADIRPGSKGSNPRWLAVMGGRLFFAANGGDGHGRELWTSDGTPGGTHIVADVRSGSEGSDPQDIVAVGSRIFFSAAFDDSSRGMWVSDGADTGTLQIPIAGVFDVWQLTKVGGKLYFVSEEAPNGPFSGRISLRVVKNGAQTSVRLTDMGYCNGPIYCHDACADGQCHVGHDLTAVGNLLFFVKPNDTLWRSDGTKSGTFKVTNLFGCNVNEGPPCAKSFTSVGGTLFFVAPRYEFQGSDYVHVATEVWKSNGTSAGTSLVKAFAPYAPWYAPGSCASYFCANFMVGASAAINGIYYFIGPDGDLWQSDGTEPGTTRACPDVEPCAGFMPSKFIVASAALYVTADAEGTGREVWRFIP